MPQPVQRPRDAFVSGEGSISRFWSSHRWHAERSSVRSMVRGGRWPCRIGKPDQLKHIHLYIFDLLIYIGFTSGIYIRDGTHTVAPPGRSPCPFWSARGPPRRRRSW